MRTSIVLGGVCLLLLVAGSLPGGEAVKAVNLAGINTVDDEDDPCLLPDNATLLYATNKAGDWDIFVSKRAAGSQNWPAGKPYIATKGADERSPFFHRATSSLYFASNEVPDEKLAKFKNFDLFRKIGEVAPIPVPGISEKTDELNPWITPGGKEFYFSRKTDDGWVQFVADGPTPGPVGKARPVGFEPGFHHATLSGSAVLMYLQGPVEEGRTGIYRSKRAKVGAPWSRPEAVAGLNHAEGKRGDLAPSLSSDGSRLYFASDRPGGKGGLDLWVVPTSALK